MLDTAVIHLYSSLCSNNKQTRKEVKMENLNIAQIITDAKAIAKQASDKYFNEQLGGQDAYCCGFAWVNIYGIRANSKVGKQLTALGIKKDDYYKSFMVWNPSEHNCQNIDTKFVGAEAFAKHLREQGFKAYPSSRLD